jgi:hypothetical protein
MKIQEFDYSVDLTQSILWQYNEATNLLSIINQKQAWYTVNQTQFWQNWYTNVFNLLTANLFGIIVWSIILNVPLYVLNSVEPSDAPIWGFNSIVGSWPTLANSYLNFGHSNFSTKGQVIPLTLEEQRFLLRLRYFQLTTRGDVTDINKFLNYLITTSNIGYTGNLYMLDGLNMTITYVFTTGDFPVNLLKIIKILDIFPRPAGVGIRYYINYGAQFGFNQIVGSWPNLENRNLNFSHGNLLRSLT